MSTYDATATKEHLIWLQRTHTLNAKHARAYYIHVTLYNQRNNVGVPTAIMHGLEAEVYCSERAQNHGARAYTLYYVKLFLNHYLGS